MRLQKLSDGTVRLSQLNAWDVQTFRHLPALADFAGHEAAERRLLPSPAVEADLTPEMGMDWVEYVIPELRDSFARNLGTVMADLENLRIQQQRLEEMVAEDAEDAAVAHEAENLEKAEAAAVGHEAENPEKSEDREGGAQGKSGGAEEVNFEGGEERAEREEKEKKNEDEDEKEHEDEEEHEDKKEDEDEKEPAASEDTTTEPVTSSDSSGSAVSVELYTLDIPAGHAEAWFRAMNQARLVLSAKHGIDSEHLPDLAMLLSSGKLEHWFQYELFVSLQGWLIDVVLDPG